MDFTSILIAAVYFAVCGLIWMSFRSMEDENIQKFNQFNDDKFNGI